jgi:hypothetical protein
MTTLRRFFASALLSLTLIFGFGSVAPAAAETTAPASVAAVQEKVDEIWIIVIETEDEIIVIIIIFESPDEAVA